MSKKRAGVLKMVEREGKPEGFALGVAALLAVIFLFTGTGPNPWQPNQAESLPPAQVRPAPVPLQPQGGGGTNLAFHQ
jgi:hypothetical protein